MQVDRWAIKSHFGRAIVSNGAVKVCVPCLLWFRATTAQMSTFGAKLPVAGFDPYETSATRCSIRGQSTEQSLVSCVLRPPTVEELPTLSALCLRSKAVWGYGSGFMEACRSELTIQACELQSTSIAVAEENGKVVGVAQVKVNGGEADLLKLFVEPTTLRGGVGMQLFHWATSEATAMGVIRMFDRSRPRCRTVLSTNGRQGLRLRSLRLNTRQNASRSW